MSRSDKSVFAMGHRTMLSLLLAMAGQAWGVTAEETPAGAGDWITRDCLLEPHMVVELSSPVAGVIASVRVDRGDQVKKGQKVVQLRADEERAVVNLNQAQLQFGKTTVERNHELFQQNLISAQELDELKLHSDMAQLELAVARTRLEQKMIVSPVEGVVLERLMDPGEYVSEMPILKIAALDPLHVEAVLPKELFGLIKSARRLRSAGGTFGQYA